MSSGWGDRTVDGGYMLVISGGLMALSGVNFLAHCFAEGGGELTGAGLFHV